MELCIACSNASLRIRARTIGYIDVMPVLMWEVIVVILFTCLDGTHVSGVGKGRTRWVVGVDGDMRCLPVMGCVCVMRVRDACV